MKVLIVGSLHFEDAEAKRDAFITACRDLGRALARAGLELVVGSESPNTADKYVVEGAIEVPGSRKIVVLRPEGKEAPFLKEREANQGRIEFIYQLMKGPWTSVRVPQVLAADVVIVIGGGRGAAQIGDVAPALGRPVLAIPSFGGAANDLWQTLEPFYKQLGSLQQKLGNLRVAWQPDNADLVIQILRESLRLRVFRREGDSMTPQIGFVATVLFLLGMWVWVFASPPSPKVIAFFSLLGISAFLGTGLRNALGLLSDPTRRLSLNNMLSEVIAGLLLAFSLAVIYLIGAFTITGKFEFISSTAKTEDFQRIALAMTVLGLTGGWLIERVAENLRQWFADQLPNQTSSAK